MSSSASGFRFIDSTALSMPSAMKGTSLVSLSIRPRITSLSRCLASSHSRLSDAQSGRLRNESARNARYSDPVCFRGLRDNRSYRFWGHRRHVIEIMNREFASMPFNADLTAHQHATVMIPQDWHQVLLRSFLRTIPIDIEIHRVTARQAVLQDIPPQPITAVRRLPCGLGTISRTWPNPHSLEFFENRSCASAPAEFFVDPVVVHDIITMHAVGSRLQVREE